MYQCECGKKYDTPQAYNGHKSHCIIHMQCHDKYEQFIQDDRSRHDTLRATVKQQKQERHNLKIQQEHDELAIWISEQHTCEKCGKIMTEKYGSGRFCSRSCANSHEHSEKTKEKIKYTLRNRQNTECNFGHSGEIFKQEYRNSYYQNPKVCLICGSIIPYEYRYRKSCSDDCLRQLSSSSISTAVRKNGGNNHDGTRGHSKYGTYKGFHCDSSWELAIVVYCLGHNISIERNKDGFSYIYNNKQCMYYPDFIIDGVYTEIKNYWTEQVQAKIDYFPSNLNYQIWYYDDIKHMLQYVKDKYGNDFCSVLYDRSYPSYMDKLL